MTSPTCLSKKIDFLTWNLVTTWTLVVFASVIGFCSTIYLATMSVEVPNLPQGQFVIRISKKKQRSLSSIDTWHTSENIEEVFFASTKLKSSCLSQEVFRQHKWIALSNKNKSNSDEAHMKVSTSIPQLSKLTFWSTSFCWLTLAGRSFWSFNF